MPGLGWNVLFLVASLSFLRAAAEAQSCPQDPLFPISSYVLDMAAPFDDPAIIGTDGPVGDDAVALINIGFTFTFYATPQATLFMSTNGFLSFSPFGAFSSSNACIPNTAFPNGILAGNWDDLVANAGETKYETIGVAPFRRFVAWWNNVGTVGSPAAPENFKIILDETTNKITFTMISTTSYGFSATRGIERQDGGTGVQVSCDAFSGGILASWTFTPWPPVQYSADLTISGSSGPNGVLTWNINSNANSAPLILVASLDPGPTNLGLLGLLSIGFTPGAFAVIADGVGVFQPPNPAHVTTPNCGTWQLSVPLGPLGLPPGLTIYHQGAVVPSLPWSPTPPNGVFHITDPEVLNT